MTGFAWLFGAVAAGAAAAGFVQGLSGFAFSLVAMSIWAWVLPPQVAAPLAVFGALLGQLSTVRSIGRGFDIKRIAPMVLGGALGVPFGVFLLHNVQPTWFKLTVGALLTIYCPIVLLVGEPPKVTAGGRGADAAVGLVGGVLGGLGGMAGLAPALWTSLRGWKRDVRRSVMQAFNIAMHILTLAAYAGTGALNANTFRLFAVVAPAMLIPSILGGRLYRRFSEAAFTRLVLLLLLASGLALLVGAGRTLLVRTAG